MRSNNNRMVWGALTALAEISKIEGKVIASNIDNVLSAADAGSVIAKDKVVEILIQLSSNPEFTKIATDHLMSRLKTAATNQLPMYAERIYSSLGEKFYSTFKTVLSSRLSDTMPDSKRRRIKKVLERLS